VDSSAAGSGPAYGPYVVGGFGLFLVVALVITVRRRQQLRYGMDAPQAPSTP
jgi:MYXO-CTERM domain-containing protein